MKTLLELLIRLDELRCCRDRVLRNPQFTNGEKTCIRSYKQIVRECLPSVVLTHYDQMKKSERALFSCPEVFAMAVLVSTYRSLSPRQRVKLVAHFTPAANRSGAVHKHGTTRHRRGGAGPLRAVRMGDINVNPSATRTASSKARPVPANARGQS
jgi:hypothetical protein